MKKISLLIAITTAIFLAIGAGYAASNGTSQAREVSIDTFMDTELDYDLALSDFDLEKRRLQRYETGQMQGQIRLLLGSKKWPQKSLL